MSSTIPASDFRFQLPIFHTRSQDSHPLICPIFNFLSVVGGQILDWAIRRLLYCLTTCITFTDIKEQLPNEAFSTDSASACPFTFKFMTSGRIIPSCHSIHINENTHKSKAISSVPQSAIISFIDSVAMISPSAMISASCGSVGTPNLRRRWFMEKENRSQLSFVYLDRSSGVTPEPEEQTP